MARPERVGANVSEHDFEDLEELFDELENWNDQLRDIAFEPEEPQP